MRIGVVGVNAKSAELSLREELAKSAQKIFDEKQLPCVLVSTCHRTEIYFSGDDLAEMHSEMLHLLRAEVTSAFEHKLYAYFGEECFSHLVDVISGLDSLIVGETEIQGQVKRAYENAHLYRELPSVLHFLFQKSFKIAKELRTHITLDAQTTFEAVIFHLYKKVLGKGPVLFVGNSEINRKILAHFAKKGVKEMTLATRAPQSAQELPVQVIQDAQVWTEFPFIIAGTSRSDYVLKPCAQTNTHLILDLSVPRSVDPLLGRHPKVTLMNIEDLSGLLRKQEERKQELICAYREYARELQGKYLYRVSDVTSCTLTMGSLTT